MYVSDFCNCMVVGGVPPTEMGNPGRKQVWRALEREDYEFAFGYVEYENV